ncbi:MAG: 1-acyl-sn-glycerol-3-phosphate acyltransferase [Gemmatimonadales bacterium]|nr:1-acyl-sn-glycerol-3-phosphate acyltransferase [Gemmatimonadales bacterium]
MNAAVWGFERYLRGLARRHFTGVHWLVRAGVPRSDTDLPTLFVGNHTNWWDGFLALLATRSLGLDYQVLMEAQHLARYPFFRRVGALPLRRSPARVAYADLKAAAPRLAPGAGLWVFPQGRRRPPQEPIADCERGAAHLIRQHRGPVRLCPVAFRYSFTSEQLPEAFLLVDTPWIAEPDSGTGRRAMMADIEARLRTTVAALDEMMRVESFAEFRPLIAGRLSVNKRLDRARHAVGLLRGPFEIRNG